MTTLRRDGPRGRAPAASREDVLTAAMARYLRGRRVDLQAIAAELGLGRATIYRWFGSREGLIGEVVAGSALPVLEEARRRAGGKGGRALLETFDRFNRAIASSPAVRSFIEQEPDAALRIIGFGSGTVQRRIGARIAELIRDEIRNGSYEPPIEPSTLAYAIVRLAEAFLFTDARAGLTGDLDRLREVEAALLGGAGTERRC